MSLVGYDVVILDVELQEYRRGLVVEDSQFLCIQVPYSDGTTRESEYLRQDIEQGLYVVFVKE